MTPKTLLIVYHADSVDLATLVPPLGEDILSAEVVYPDTVRTWVKDASIWRRFRAYDKVVLYTHDAAVAPDPLVAACAGAWLGRTLVMADLRGRASSVRFVPMLTEMIRDALRLPAWKRALHAHLSELEATLARRAATPSADMLPDLHAPVAYLRPDVIVNLRAGGSVGHVAGVLNNLHHVAGAPIFFTVDPLPTVDASVVTHCIRPSEADRSALPGTNTLRFSRPFAAAVWRTLNGTRPAFIYQRHGLDNWSGAELALTHRIPFVLEYNGSEVWVARNWGRPVRHEALSLRVEMLALRAADLVVVVSAPLRDELVERGIAPDRILVNPNGVDTAVYHPAVDGTPIRARYGMGAACVIGFIGTFGKWHGAEKMAEACVLLLRRRPELRDTLRMLYIGDGVMRTTTESIFRQAGLDACAIFTGVVPQAEGPAHLAACDVLVAPHVPNADGSRFFGSPTKLFEYMAMGKAIAASALDQLDELLEHEVTALKATPGDAQSLSEALERLVDDAPLRARLGQNARVQAEARHTWRAHTEWIVQALLARWGA